MGQKEITIEVVRSNKSKFNHSIAIENAVFVLQHNTLNNSFTITPRVFSNRDDAITYCADNKEEINTMGLEDYNKYFILYGQEVRPIV